MHFDSNIIFVIVAAIIGISRLVARISENAREQSQRREKQTKPQGQIQQQQTIFTHPKTDEERVREFLEALGQPAGTAPPRKVAPRTDIPPRPVAPISPPPLPTPFPPVFRRTVVEETRRIPTPTAPLRRDAPRTISRSPAAESEEPGAWLLQEEKTQAAAAKFEAATRMPVTDAITSQSPLANWKDALRSRDSIRTAFVLREILGPPRSLREPEFA